MTNEVDEETTPPPAAPPEVHDELTTRLDGLAAAVGGARGRLDDATLAPAEALTSRASDRLRMSGEHTIVALAGATGSGKSSLFNSLTDMELAGVGVRRPTTSWALACAWGPDGASELLEWMGVPPRHQVSRMGMLERAESDTSLEGLILLDLPDHDSTEVSHHVEMERLVTHSDLLIWVLDPQKYADAAIHERYIRKMAGFGAVTMVVLNQIDRIPYEQRSAAIADVKRLIEEDGLPDVKVLGVSASRGDGLDDLRRELAARIRAKSAAKARLLADVGDAARAIEQAGGTTPVQSIGDGERRRLAEAVADSAGISQLAESAGEASRLETVRRSRWPVFGLFDRGRPRPTAPEIGQVQRSSTGLAVRDFVDDVGSDLSSPWRASIRAAAQSEGGSVTDSLQRSMSDGDVRLDVVPAWARVGQVVQMVALAAAVVGVLWLGGWALDRWAGVDLGLPDLDDVAGLPVPVWVAIGGIAIGLVVDGVARLLARSGSAKRADEIDRSLRSAVDDVTRRQVVEPVESELANYTAYRKGLLAALSE